MFEIQGMYNKAIVFTDVIEKEAIDQIKTICDLDYFKDCQIRIMPDVHTGKGCTIGTTMTIKDKIIPYMLGVDIGCGMLTINLGKIDIDLKEFDEACHTIPVGYDVWPARMERYDLSELKCFRNLRDTKRLEKSLGTLGGGNHFIELDKASNGDIYLVIHTGSRQLGLQVAEYYQNIAVELNKGKDEYFKKQKEIIETYKQQGRKNEIQEALGNLALQYSSNKETMPKELCYLYGEYMDDYLKDVVICQKFAKRNRELIGQTILKKMHLKPIDVFETIHNFISVDEMILRKGAISAKKDEKVLIPINMAEGSIIAIGKGNEQWNYSAPHGAGRRMSRTVAKENLSMAEFEKKMEGIYSTSICENTIDESPMAYKSLADIIDNIVESAEVIEVIKPIYNFKCTK